MNHTLCRVSVIQMNTGAPKEEHLSMAEQKIREAGSRGADFVVLPEMFQSPYETSQFPVYAETADGESARRLSKAAKEAQVYLIGGSIPECEGDRIYNTSLVFGRDGSLLAKHRKVHLFDIDVKGGQYFKESETLSPGNEATVFQTEFGPVGVCICYDIRFPELFRLMADRGANLVFCPAAFNRTTGPKHWELLFRSRAVDNQLFLVGAAPAADETASYISYGHSIVVSPWGEVLAQAGEGPCVLEETLDLSQIKEVREQIPVLKHLRRDLY